MNSRNSQISVFVTFTPKSLYIYCVSLKNNTQNMQPNALYGLMTPLTIKRTTHVHACTYIFIYVFARGVHMDGLSAMLNAQMCRPIKATWTPARRPSALHESRMYVY